MKWIFAILLFISIQCYAQVKPFRFAFISDTHIGSPDGKAEEDLRRTVRDINNRTDIDFTVLTGDITELGTKDELKRAKLLLDSLDKKWYIIPGNHDVGWSESGGLDFVRTFGNDKFLFDHNGIRFIGCSSGPYVRMSDGHIPRDAMNWMKKVLDTTPATMPVIFLNHYPMDNQMDNWYEVTELFKKKNTVLFLCGHGHANKLFNFEDIPGVMGRSNLRAKQPAGGYNIVDVRTDSILFSVVNPVTSELKGWTSVEFKQHNYDLNKTFPRPDYSINKQYPRVSLKWIHHSPANVISTPAIIGNKVVFGNQAGTVTALDYKNGKPLWTYQTEGPVFSSPAAHNNKIVLGSADGKIYCINEKGVENWKVITGAAVLGSPVIENNTVFIGGSDHRFRSIDLESGKERWSYDSLAGPVVSTPVIYKNDVIFGAWDTHLYSINKYSGKLNWKWSNGSQVKNFSPASCIPVIYNDVIYIVAPDRYLSAIDATNGNTLWRTNESRVRESIGISNDGKYLYTKTMMDTLAVFPTGRESGYGWKLNLGFGYQHSPSMLIEKNGQVFFGTRDGLVYAIDVIQRKIIWAHKIDNSMVNTVLVIDNRNVVASTMDGKVVLLRVD